MGCSWFKPQQETGETCGSQWYLGETWVPVAGTTQEVMSNKLIIGRFVCLFWLYFDFIVFSEYKFSARWTKVMGTAEWKASRTRRWWVWSTERKLDTCFSQAWVGVDSISFCPPCLDWCLMAHSCVGYSAVRPHESCFKSAVCWLEWCNCVNSCLSSARHSLSRACPVVALNQSANAIFLSPEQCLKRSRKKSGGGRRLD